MMVYRRHGTFLFFIYIKQTFLICRYLILLKESRISVWRNYVNDIYIELIQIAFLSAERFESILFVVESNNCNETNIKLSCGLYENKK